VRCQSGEYVASKTDRSNPMPYPAKRRV